MSIAILSLKWGMYKKPDPNSHLTRYGWGIQIQGLTQSDRINFLNQTGSENIQVVSENERPASLLSSPWHQLDFCTDHGAMSTDLPLDCVTEYLNVLAEMNYKVVGTQAVHSRMDNQVTSIWTLQKN